jgi:hypothetical protein
VEVDVVPLILADGELMPLAAIDDTGVKTTIENGDHWHTPLPSQSLSRTQRLGGGIGGGLFSLSGSLVGDVRHARREAAFREVRLGVPELQELGRLPEERGELVAPVTEPQPGLETLVCR